MPNQAKDVSLIQEAPTQYMTAPISRYNVNYWVTTPKGSKSRFSATGNISQLYGAHSETAVLQYLRTKHPGTEIAINAVSFS